MIYTVVEERFGGIGAFRRFELITNHRDGCVFGYRGYAHSYQTDEGNWYCMAIPLSKRPPGLFEFHTDLIQTVQKMIKVTNDQNQ